MKSHGPLHGHKWVELIINADDGQLSASRFGMLCMVLMMCCIDIASLFLILTYRFDKVWFTPLAGMNSATVGSLALAYYGSTRRGLVGDLVGRVIGGNNPVIDGPSRQPPPKPAPPQGEGS